jgi:hypothetical protein
MLWEDKKKGERGVNPVTGEYAKAHPEEQPIVTVVVNIVIEEQTVQMSEIGKDIVCA